jgi:DNA-binding response OmpR family regulator
MIWVVTEHQEARRSLASLLTQKGYEAAEIDCGDEVLRRVRFQEPKAIILDCGVRDSFDMLKALRTEHKARTVPVVMFSIDDQNLKEKALLTGADAYVPKGSLDWAELLMEVVRFAGRPSDTK